MTFKPPRVSELRQVASIQAYTATGYDENGQVTGSWEQVSLEYVRLDGVSGRLIEIAQQQYATATHMIYLRYNPLVTRSTRFVIGSKVYSIGWVDYEGEQWMRCTVEEQWPSDEPAESTVETPLYLENGTEYLRLESGTEYMQLESG